MKARHSTPTPRYPRHACAERLAFGSDRSIKERHRSPVTERRHSANGGGVAMLAPRSERHRIESWGMIGGARMVARLVCLIVSLLFLPAFGASAQQVKLRATIQVPLTERLWGVALARFKEEVEKRSENTVVIEVFDKGKLYIDDEAVDAVASG